MTEMRTAPKFQALDDASYRGEHVIINGRFSTWDGLWFYDLRTPEQQDGRPVQRWDSVPECALATW